MPASSLGLNSTILQKAEEEDSPAVFSPGWNSTEAREGPSLGAVPAQVPNRWLPTSCFVPDDGHVSSRDAEPCEGPKLCCGFFFKTFYLF